MIAHHTIPEKTVGGFVPVYRQGSDNFCPACTKSNWWIGRHSAQCGFCGCTLPLATALKEFEVAA